MTAQTCPKCGHAGYLHAHLNLYRCKATGCGECWTPREDKGYVSVPGKVVAVGKLTWIDPPPVVSNEARRRKRQRVQAALAEARAGVMDLMGDGEERRWIVAVIEDASQRVGRGA